MQKYVTNQTTNGLNLQCGIVNNVNEFNDHLQVFCGCDHQEVIQCGKCELCNYVAHADDTRRDQAEITGHNAKWWIAVMQHAVLATTVTFAIGSLSLEQLVVQWLDVGTREVLLQ